MRYRLYPVTTEDATAGFFSMISFLSIVPNHSTIQFLFLCILFSWLFLIFFLIRYFDNFLNVHGSLLWILYSFIYLVYFKTYLQKLTYIVLNQYKHFCIWKLHTHWSAFQVCHIHSKPQRVRYWELNLFEKVFKKVFGIIRVKESI